MSAEVSMAVLMICLNEEQFLDICLNKIYDYADQILIAEGATRLAVELGWSGPDGRSSDRTIEILNAWAQREKIKVIGSGDWKDKPEMGNRLLKELNDGITHIHIVDPDELYEHSELELIKGVLAGNDAEIFRIQAMHYGPGGGTINGGELDLFYHRIYRWKVGRHFHPRSINILVDDNASMKEFMIRDFKYKHYGHINPKKSQVKVAYYHERKKRWTQS